MNEKTYLYRHYNKNDKLLYVGISLCYLIRTKHHEGNSFWFGDVHSIKIKSFSTRAEAEHAEKVAIKNEAPLYNKTFSNKKNVEKHTHKEKCDYIYIRLEEDIKDKIKEQAQKEGMNMTIWARHALIKTIELIDQ